MATRHARIDAIWVGGAIYELSTSLTHSQSSLLALQSIGVARIQKYNLMMGPKTTSMSSQPKRLRVLVLVCSLAVLLLVHDAAAAHGSIVFSAKGHGVELSVKIPRQGYALNSLIQARIRIRNDSRRVIEMPGFPEYCGSDNPSVFVNDPSGKQLYPPGVTPIFPPPCPFPRGEALAHNQTANATQYAIARGPYLQVALQVLRVRVGGSSGMVTVLTHSVRLQFVPKPAATVTLHPSRSGLYAIFHRPTGARGPMLFEASDNCAPQDAQPGHQALSWEETLRTRLTPSCPAPARWVVVAGWLNYPVAQIDYTTP